MNCNDFSTGLVCFNDGAVNQTLVAHYQYGIDATGKAILVATRYTDASGVVIDTSAGTVTAGACALIPADVEFALLCDIQSNGSVVEFLRRSVTTFDSVGVPTLTVTNWELDKTTAYVITGTVGACNQDCDAAVPLGVLTSWG
jgi:hypothetical protein